MRRLGIPREADIAHQGSMRILFLTENFPPEVNAAASRVYERAVYWARDGHVVTVVTSFPNFPQGKVYEGYRQRLWKVDDMDGIRVVRVPTFVARNEGVLLRTLDFVSFMFSSILASAFLARPDVVVATSPQFFCAVSGWFTSLIKRRPFIFELGDLWPASIAAVGALQPGLAIRMLEKLELFLYRRSAAIVALTNSFKLNLVSRGIGGEKISVIRNGVDLERYAPRPRDLALAKSLGLESKFVVGYLGTHGMAHDLNNVLTAASILADVADIRFLFVGDGAAKAGLVARVRDEGLLNVIFVDPQPKDAMSQYWSLCDLALVHLKDNPVFADVIPSKIFEAMGMGVPIVLVSPKGEASEIVLEETNCGVWVPSGQPGSLADAVRSLKNAPQQLDIFRRQCLMLAPQHSRYAQAKSFMDVLNMVATQRSGDLAS